MTVVPDLAGGPLDILEQIRRILVPDSMFYYTSGFNGDFELRNADGELLASWKPIGGGAWQTIKHPVR